MKLKSVQQFITYNNIIPIGLGIVFLGGALASAQTAGISFSNFTAPTNPAHVDIDTRAIEEVDFANHNFNPTVDVVQETDRDYVLTVGLDDYDIRNSAWQSIRMRHTIEIRKSLISSTEELQEKISVEVNDLVEYRRMVLQKAQDNANRQLTSNSVDLASVLGGVTVEEEQVSSSAQVPVQNGFVQGSHRPEDRVNPEQNNSISGLIALAADPLADLYAPIIEEPAGEPTVAVVTDNPEQSNFDESSSESVEADSGQSDEPVVSTTVTDTEETATSTTATSTSVMSNPATTTASTTESVTEESATSTQTQEAVSTSSEITAEEPLEEQTTEEESTTTDAVAEQPVETIPDDPVENTVEEEPVTEEEPTEEGAETSEETVTEETGQEETTENSTEESEDTTPAETTQENTTQE